MKAETTYAFQNLVYLLVENFLLLLFDGGSGLFSFLLAVYYVMVTRSHALKLEEEAAERPRVLPADSVTVVTRRVNVPDGAQV